MVRAGHDRREEPRTSMDSTIPYDLHTQDIAGWQPVDDWTSLVGLHVEVHEGGKEVDRGRVECVTADGGIMWLEQNGPVLRRIIEKLPDTYVRLTVP